MRNLERDTQPVHIARFVELAAQEVEGKLTGKHVPKRALPETFSPSVSMARGEAQGAYFGVSLDYDRVLTIDDPHFEASEADVLWIEADPGNPEQPNPHDHIIKKVARKGGYTVIAAKRVEVGA